jgi:large subunit ribosomal protein L15
VKILGVGELTKKLSVSAHGFSASARRKIEQAGGTVVFLRGEPEAPRAKPGRARETPAEAEPETEPEPSEEG